MQMPTESQILSASEAVTTPKSLLHFRNTRRIYWHQVRSSSLFGLDFFFLQQMIKIITSSFRDMTEHLLWFQKEASHRKDCSRKEKEHLIMYLNNKTSYTFNPSFPIFKSNSALKCNSAVGGNFIIDCFALTRTTWKARLKSLTLK